MWDDNNITTPGRLKISADNSSDDNLSTSNCTRGRGCKPLQKNIGFYSPIRLNQLASSSKSSSTIQSSYSARCSSQEQVLFDQPVNQRSRESALSAVNNIHIILPDNLKVQMAEYNIPKSAGEHIANLANLIDYVNDYEGSDKLHTIATSPLQLKLPFNVLHLVHYIGHYRPHNYYEFILAHRFVWSSRTLLYELNKHMQDCREEAMQSLRQIKKLSKTKLQQLERKTKIQLADHLFLMIYMWYKYLYNRDIRRLVDFAAKLDDIIGQLVSHQVEKIKRVTIQQQVLYQSTFKYIPELTELYESFANKVATQSLLQIPIKILAEQLTIRDCYYYQQIDLHEFMHNQWNKRSDIAKHIKILITDADRLSWLVVNDILISNNPIAAYEYFQRLCQQLLDLHNYHSALSVYIGLNQHILNFITWQLEHTAAYKDFEKVAEIFDMSSNWINYRNKINNQVQNFIPVLSLLLRDITFANDHLYRLLEYKDLREDVLADALIGLGNILKYVVNIPMQPYNIVHEIQYILHTRVKPNSKDIKELATSLVARKPNSRLPSNSTGSNVVESSNCSSGRSATGSNIVGSSNCRRSKISSNEVKATAACSTKEGSKINRSAGRMGSLIFRRNRHKQNNDIRRTYSAH